VFNPKRRQHTFGDSAGDRSGFTTILSNNIMANIEELNEEDKRKYTKLHDYIKQQFPFGTRKDHSGKVTMAQERQD
jgi:hypothetical protein